MSAATNRDPQTITDPVLIDKALVEINSQLAVLLPWLAYAFGKSEKIVVNRDNREMIVPAIYSANGEYIRLFPDENLGCFSFFFIENERLDQSIRTRPAIVCDYRQVFWFDFRDVFTANAEEHHQKTKEHVKLLCSDAMLAVRYPGLSITTNSFQDDPAVIYKGYSIDRAKPVFYMRPKGVFQMSGQITFKTNC